MTSTADDAALRHATLRPLTPAELDVWRNARTPGASWPIPDRLPPTLLALGLIIDGRPRARLLVEREGDDLHVRVIEGQLPPERLDVWRVAVGLLERLARKLQAQTLRIAVPAHVDSPLRALGFQGVIARYQKPAPKALDPAWKDDPDLTVRPMTRSEFDDWVVDARREDLEGTTRAGGLTARVPVAAADRLPGLEALWGREDQVFLTGVRMGQVVGRCWLTLERRDGAVDGVYNTIDLLPEFRGRGLYAAFATGVVRQLLPLNLRYLRANAFGHDHATHRLLEQRGYELSEAWLRKDVTPARETESVASEGDG